MIDCVLLYVDEIYLRGKQHRQRRSTLNKTQLEAKVIDMIRLVFFNLYFDFIVTNSQYFGFIPEYL